VSSSTRNRTLISGGLALVAFLVFSPALRGGFVNFDDPVYVTKNARVLAGLTWSNVRWAFGNFDAGFWHPLTWLSYLLDAECYGKRAFGFHLTNLCLHSANTALLFLVWEKMTRAPRRSACVALLFALHPLHVESVAWIADRKDLLSTLFWLLSLLAYAGYVAPAETAACQRSTRYLLSLFFFAGGLLSKSSVVTLPLVLLLLDGWPLQRFWGTASDPRQTLKRFRELAFEKLPFFAGSLLCGWLTIVAEKKVGAVAPAGAFPMLGRLENAVVSCVVYLRQTVWPSGLAAYYPYEPARPAWAVAGALVLLVAACAVAVRMRRTHPYVFVGWFWYLVTLLPVIGLIQIGGHAHADRYTYVPLMGIFAALIWVLAGLDESWRMPRIAWIGSAAAIAIALAAGTIRQIGYWRDSEQLFRHTLAVTRRNAFAEYSLGCALHDAGRIDQAIPHYHAALQMAPDNVEVLDNLAAALAAQGNTSEAMAASRRALEIDPDDAAANYHLANGLAATGGTPLAVGYYTKAIQRKPDFLEAVVNLGDALFAARQFAAATNWYYRALTIDSNCVDAYENLGVILVMDGRVEQGMAMFGRAIQLAPDEPDPHFNLGHTLAGQGRWPEAVREFREVLRINPNDPVAAMFCPAWGKIAPRLWNGRKACALNPTLTRRRSGWGK